MAAQTVYEVRSLFFRYGSARKEHPWVVRDVNLRVDRGEMLGIVGPNGSGKTSLLKLLAKILRQQEGEITLFGQSLETVTQNEVARQVAFVPQDNQPTFAFSVAETVLMGRFPHRPRSRWDYGFGWDSREDWAIARQAMITMDVWHLAERSVMDLSGGERQRTVIARALTQTPTVLLLDEPTAFLDLQHQLEICSVLRSLKEHRGLTIVIVSHDLNIASQYCDRIAVLKEGTMFAMGSPREVIRQDVLQAVYGCSVLVDAHPESGLPRITLPREGVRSR
ncbi:MAG TPA: ABC transporter ATP-binding protein [Nitrospira sp.]|nr:ABC transporter ATP-binding protein [Nitrospira sp.]